MFLSIQKMKQTALISLTLTSILQSLSTYTLHYDYYILCFERDKDGFFNSELDAFTEVCFVLTFVVPMEAAESHAIHHAIFAPFTRAHGETVDLALWLNGHPI